MTENTQVNEEHIETTDTPVTDNAEQAKSITLAGLWENNPALVQLLGLCPLLAVTASAVNGLGLGIATLLVLMGSNISVSLIRQFVPGEIRIPVFVMIIATFVTTIQLLMNAYTWDLYQSLGIFIPLIVTNCVIIGRAEAFASRNNPLWAALDGFMMGLGFTIVLVLLGGVREILGQGTLFDGAERLLGAWAAPLRIEVLQIDSAFLLAILPPGAFLAMGFFIAAKNAIDKKLDEKKKKTIEQPAITRARVTRVTE